MIRTEGGRVEIEGDYVDLISDFGCIARTIGKKSEKKRIFTKADRSKAAPDG